MPRKIAGHNLVTLPFYVDASAATNDVVLALGELDRDYTEVLKVTVDHQVAGVGAQNINYDVRVGSTLVTAVSSAIANTTKDARTNFLGTGPTTVLTEGSRLDINLNFANAVTNGPKIAVIVLLRP